MPSSAAATMVTPQPTYVPAAPTVVARRADSNRARWIAIIVIPIVFVVALALFYTHWGSSEDTPPTSTIAMRETAPPPQAQPAETSVSVVAPTTTTVATRPSPPAPLPADAGRGEALKPETLKAETPLPVEPPTPHVEESNVATYVEGGDGDANEPLLEHLRSELHGVNRIALQGGAMQDELAKALQHEIPSLTITDSADVTVRFDGTLEHLGRGRKRRAAQATVVKHGRVVFRYEMPSEVYRVGDTPAEAFAAALKNAFER